MSNIILLMVPIIKDLLLFLANIFFSIYTTLALLRLILQLVKADFYNPISQLILKATNPVIFPLRRIIPSFFRIDTASIIFIFLLQFINISIIALLNTGDFLNPIVVSISAVFGIISELITLYTFTIIAIAILSWIQPNNSSPIINLIHQINYPLTSRARKLLPNTGMFDFSPIVILILLGIIKIISSHLQNNIISVI